MQADKDIRPRDAVNTPRPAETSPEYWTRKRLQLAATDFHGASRNHVSPHFRRISPLSLVNRSRLISPTSRWRPAENSHPREEELDPFQLNRVFRESAGFRVERMQFPRESFPFAEGNYGNIGNE